jgi:hypothetical protein
MSIIINGNAGNVTTPLTATVTALANNGAGAIRVTTSSPHHFGSSDLVLMAAGPAQGAFGITVIDATHFDLIGSTYTTTGTGTATDTSLTPAIQFPTDGDAASMQLGLLSGLQGLADRTQYLMTQLALRSIQVATVSSAGSGTINIPDGTLWFLVLGAGSGGSGGGGCGGWSGTSQAGPGGSGGSGARLCFGLFPALAAKALDYTVPAATSGGAAGAAGATPTDGGNGADGNATTLAYHSSTTIFTAEGGSAGAGGAGLLSVGGSSTPIWTPGGRGPRGAKRSAPVTQTSPGPENAINLSVGGGATWNAAVYNDPRGPMDPNEGGGSVHNGGNSTYAAAVSYYGMPDVTSGNAGGSGGAYGTASSPYPGGGSGGGGGGGGFGAGGNGGNGGNSNASGPATAGAVGGNGSVSGGGAGGGAGGNGSTGGAGGAGGPGGSGYLQIMFIGAVTTP